MEEGVEVLDRSFLYVTDQMPRGRARSLADSVVPLPFWKIELLEIKDIRIVGLSCQLLLGSPINGVGDLSHSVVEFVEQ